MTKDEIIRFPVVVEVFQKIYHEQSTCRICGLPWEVCGKESIDITDSYGVFYVCPYCFKKSDIKQVIEATALGYFEQYKSLILIKDVEDFIKTHNLMDILEKTKEKYIKKQKETK